MRVRNPIITVLLSLVVMFVGDALIFRSGLYAKVLKPTTVYGSFYLVAQNELDRPPSGKSNVLLLGHSKMLNAFSFTQYEETYPNSSLNFVPGYSAGTDEKSWYYFLRYVDPNRDRYAAIVIPQDFYSSPPGGNQDNEYATVQTVTPFLSLGDWPRLIASYTDPKVRRSVIYTALLNGHAYAVDLQDLLFHPVDRYRELKWNWDNRVTWTLNFPGLDGSLEDLRWDHATGTVEEYPAHLNSFDRAALQQLLRPPGASAKQQRREANQYFQYKKRWLTAILTRYAGTPTKFIILQVPHWPFPLPGLQPVPGAPDIRKIVNGLPSVTVLPSELFEEIESPEMFYDAYHVNRAGRHRFTEIFGAVIGQDLGAG